MRKGCEGTGSRSLSGSRGMRARGVGSDRSVQGSETIALRVIVFLGKEALVASEAFRTRAVEEVCAGVVGEARGDSRCMAYGGDGVQGEASPAPRKFLGMPSPSACESS